MSAAIDALARGWCPGVARPMATGDGLLLRVHPRHGLLSLAQAQGLAEVAAGCGNGVLDITSHANAQVRGVGPETLPAAQAQLTALGLADPSARPPYRATVLSPLAGLDPDERAEGLAFADRVERVARSFALPPKFLIGIDTGGAFHLDALTPDLWLDVLAGGALRLGLGGVPVLWGAPFAPDDLESCLSTLLAACLAALRETGARRVARLPHEMRLVLCTGMPLRSSEQGADEDLDEDLGEDLDKDLGEDLDKDLGQHLGAGFGRGRPPLSHPLSAPALPEGAAPPPWPRLMPKAGRVALRAGAAGLLAAAPFGQMSAAALAGLAALVARLGSDAIRLTPSRGVLLAGLRPEQVEDATAGLSALGFITDAQDPRLRVLTCPGAPACARGRCDTHGLATRLAAVLPPGGDDIHLSACEKGCARRGASPVTLVARADDFAVIVAGGPLDPPLTYLPFDAIARRFAAASDVRGAFQEPGPSHAQS